MISQLTAYQEAMATQTLAGFVGATLAIVVGDASDKDALVRRYNIPNPDQYITEDGNSRQYALFALAIANFCAEVLVKELQK